VVEALERNAPVIILADGHAEALHGLPVAGIEVPFAPGAVSLARATGAPLLPAFVVDEPGRTGPASLRLIIHPPLDLQVTDDRRADIEENLRRFVNVYEKQMRACPHNFKWSWVRDGTFGSPRGRRERGASPAPAGPGVT
jgi:lauroyl/myristoyl acyltransferase